MAELGKIKVREILLKFVALKLLFRSTWGGGGWVVVKHGRVLKRILRERNVRPNLNIFINPTISQNLSIKKSMSLLKVKTCKCL